MSRRPTQAGWRTVAAMAGCGLAAASAPAEDAVTTAVYSQKDPSYQRTRLADGGYEREFYVMSNAGKLPGSLQDNTQAKVPFTYIAGILARHLAKENYFPAESGATAGLVLVIHWGTTIPFVESNYTGQTTRTGDVLGRMMNARGRGGEPGARPSGLSAANPLAADAESKDAGSDRIEDLETQFEQEMLHLMIENKSRDRANERNARMLGYLSEINKVNGIQRWAGGGDYYNDLVGDIEETRYYVVISAYDFKKTVKEKAPKLLWVTRVSIRSPGNNFADKVDAMIGNAAKFFGQESGRLVRQYTPEGRVEIGEATVVGVVAEPAAAQQPKPPAKPAEK